MNESRPRGFTIIELLIIIAIVATIVAIVVLVLNPVEYIKRGRDAQRLRDYTLINNSVNFYSYSASLLRQDPDYDGPNYSNSCVGQSNQRLFVSVPSDNGESDPSPPSGWVYSRVSSTPLRNINGSGWLPVDFGSITESIRPLNILPVDPINTFADGFYYTYTCGSFEFNLRFETSKYNELASTDGGDDPDVYEVGFLLTTAPYQGAYHPTTGGSSSGTVALYPNGTGFYSQWVVAGAASGWQAVAVSGTSDYVSVTSTGRAATFALDNPGQSGTITNVRMTWKAKQGFTSAKISPRIRVNSTNYEGTAVTPNAGAYTTVSNVATWSTNPYTGSAWTWNDVNNLEAGAYSTGTYSGATVDLAYFYVEVDYTSP